MSRRSVVKSPRVSETALGRIVVAWLEREGWDVYQEVPFGGATLDIVALHGAVTTVIELKSSLGLNLIAQCEARRAIAHAVYAAAPYARRTDTQRLAEDICRTRGIGVLRVDVGDAHHAAGVREVVAVTPRTSADDAKLRAALRPEHKTYCAAGSPSPSPWTDWKQTCAEVARVVAAEPGIGVASLVAKIKHHYRTASSARTSIAKWARVGKIPGVRLDEASGAICLVPSEAAE